MPLRDPPPPSRPKGANDDNNNNIASSSPSCPIADPFAVPDNVYRDSWLDSLWINLFSSRMSAAVEAEAFARRRAGGEAGGGAQARQGTNSPLLRLATPAPLNREGLIPQRTLAEQQILVEVNDPLPTTSPTTLPTTEKTAGEGRKGAFLPVEEDGVLAESGGVNGRRIGVEGIALGLGGGFSIKSRRSDSSMGSAYTYDDYVSLATRLQAGPPERQRQVVRGVLLSIFPAWFPALYRVLFPRSKVGGLWA